MLGVPNCQKIGYLLGVITEIRPEEYMSILFEWSDYVTCSCLKTINIQMLNLLFNLLDYCLKFENNQLEKSCICDLICCFMRKGL